MDLNVKTATDHGMAYHNWMVYFHKKSYKLQHMNEIFSGVRLKRNFDAIKTRKKVCG